MPPGPFDLFAPPGPVAPPGAFAVPDGEFDPTDPLGLLGPPAPPTPPGNPPPLPPPAADPGCAPEEGPLEEGAAEEGAAGPPPAPAAGAPPPLTPLPTWEAPPWFAALPPAGEAAAEGAGCGFRPGDPAAGTPWDAPVTGPGAWRAPVTGFPVSAAYGTPGSWAAGHHTGVDFAAPAGTPVHAAGPGVVEQAGPAGDYGKAVLLRMEDGTYTLYAHLSRIGVAEGEGVTADTVLGDSGNTGNSTGPHLHFEVRSHPGYGSDLDPEAYLTGHGAAGL
ncbi:M23 family metallopeptidase [Streptomyces hoynatensis]|uniref:M23 family metallopeptidase n=1 Tax=Streptomyces hoynatensis TaxID=1141874 RepID=A0A3A9YMZ8_9ACTN|nr:M23 family metallopeptidase [Streptomyces hoynatensis]RKN37668.1 M23 family metallopeptidase [Streptomyces hoynatensis]